MNIDLEKSEIEIIQKLASDPTLAGNPDCESILGKIQKANKIGRNRRLHNLNVQLREITVQNYFPSQSDFWGRVTTLLSDNGIFFEGEEIGSTDSRNFDLGRGIFLSVSTYLMPTGKVEIVAYFHG